MFLRLDAVSVQYARSHAGRAAVEATSLNLTRGQIGVLVGPAGCGKTSLLRAIAGLERCAAGRITMDNDDAAPTQAPLSQPSAKRSLSGSGRPRTARCNIWAAMTLKVIPLPPNPMTA